MRRAMMLLLFTFGVLLPQTQLFAQGCAGMPAVNGVCIPPDSPTSPLYQHPAGDRGYWENRWGAVYMDHSTGDVGIAAAEVSEAEAEASALERCSELGAMNCKLLHSFRNGCMAIAVPINQDGDNRGRMTALSHSSHQLATEDATALCAKRRGSACEVIYAECSLPVWFR